MTPRRGADAHSQGLALSAYWPIAGGSYQSSNATLGNFEVKWNAFMAEPPIDPNAEPR